MDILHEEETIVKILNHLKQEPLRRDDAAALLIKH